MPSFITHDMPCLVDLKKMKKVGSNEKVSMDQDNLNLCISVPARQHNTVMYSKESGLGTICTHCPKDLQIQGEKPKCKIPCVDMKHTCIYEWM